MKITKELPKRLQIRVVCIICKKQIAGNYSSPATEDTGIKPEKFKKANKQAQGVINKIFRIIRVLNIGNGSGFDSTGYMDSTNFPAAYWFISYSKQRTFYLLQVSGYMLQGYEPVT